MCAHVGVVRRDELLQALRVATRWRGVVASEQKEGRDEILHKPDNDYVLEYVKSMGGRPRAPRKRRASAGYMVG
jgi:hypothetical protein